MAISLSLANGACSPKSLPVVHKSPRANHFCPVAIRHRVLRRVLIPLRGCGTSNCVIPFFFFLFGIVLGSFLNVCISRIPERISIVSPASHCPRCKSPIKPYDNIPVFSWLLLRGKCRNCHLPISPMYPIVEFLTGALFVGVYFTYHVEFALGMYLPMVKCLF